VHAQVGAQAVYVINPDIAAGATGATAVSTGYLAQVKPKLDGIQWLIAKVAIQAITKSMVNWINSGFNGSPAFVTNLDQNLLSVSDGVANSFFSALSNNTGNGVVSPFQNLVTQQLRNSYYSSTGRSSGGGYDLNKFSNNPAGFLAGNFVANGGFNAWFAAVGNNSNNPYGAAYDAQNQLNAAVYQATTNRLNELNWGKGFMSWRGPCTSKAPAAAATSLSTADNCTQYSIKTPGSIVEDSLGITVNSPLRQLELSDSINQVVGALAGQLINQVVGGAGLSGISQPSSGGGSSILDQATNPSQYSSTNGGNSSGLIQPIANDLITAQNYLAAWQKIKSIASSCVSTNSAVTSALTQADTNISRATRAISALNALSAQATAVSTNVDSAQLSAIATNYQNLIATTSGAYITSQDLSDATAQSTPATSGSTSLYTTLSGTCAVSI
jgi:hypothetical protein